MVCYANRKYNYYNSPLPSLVGKFVNSITIVHSNVMTQIPCTIFLCWVINYSHLCPGCPSPHIKLPYNLSREQRKYDVDDLFWARSGFGSWSQTTLS